MRSPRLPLPRRAARARAWVLLALAPAAIGLYGCGESKEEKAEKSVCAARSDIKEKVTSLQSLTPTTASISQIKTDVNEIVEDLKTIRDAIPDLASPRKEEVTKATEQFAKEASEAVGSLKTTGSISSVEAELRSALTGLQTAYNTALAPIKCS
jgi:Tfp pilus assembly protein PilP